MKDARRDLLTRTDLQNLDTLQGAISSLRDYGKEYTFDRYEQVRLAAPPFMARESAISWNGFSLIGKNICTGACS
jgi:hypothetical protein